MASAGHLFALGVTQMTGSAKEVFVGIDVGKKALEVAIWGQEQSWEVANNVLGIEKLVERLRS